MKPSDDAEVLAFETEDLLGSKSAARAVLLYLFHRIERVLDGRPTLIGVDEAWFALDDPVFAPKLREWLKTLRRKNASVLFSTQSLADVMRSAIAPAVIESCLSRIFLPNARAIEPESREAYERLGLNARQIETIARAVPKRDYWFQSAAGCRLFELALGPVALAICGASSAGELAAIDRVLAESGSEAFASAWLRVQGLPWAADLDRGASRRLRQGSRRRCMRSLKKTLLAAVITAPFLTAPPQAQAQWAVIDTANLAQNIMTAAHSLEEVNNQITQIQQFVQMLEYAARNVATLPFSILSQLQSSMTELDSLMDQAQSLSYDVNRLEQQFQDLYPNYGASGGV